MMWDRADAVGLSPDEHVAARNAGIVIDHSAPLLLMGSETRPEVRGLRTEEALQAGRHVIWLASDNPRVLGVLWSANAARQEALRQVISGIGPRADSVIVWDPYGSAHPEDFGSQVAVRRVKSRWEALLDMRKEVIAGHVGWIAVAARYAGPLTTWLAKQVNVSWVWAPERVPGPRVKLMASLAVPDPKGLRLAVFDHSMLGLGSSPRHGDVQIIGDYGVANATAWHGMLIVPEGTTALGDGQGEPIAPVVVAPEGVHLRLISELTGPQGNEPWAALALQGDARWPSLEERVQQLGGLGVLDAGTVLKVGPLDDLPLAVGHAVRRRVKARMKPKPELPPQVMASDVKYLWHNKEARELSLQWIDEAQERVHVAMYMFEDDKVGNAFVDALLAAGRRGVTVRVTVDSLYSRHHSLGMKQKHLLRLEAGDNVTLRPVWPVELNSEGVALKRRDHRKLLIVDGQRAIVGGRNFANSYYTGFDEVPVSPTLDSHDLPWVDAQVAFGGEAVRSVDEGFLDRWVACGGSSFALRGEGGDTPCRFWWHEGLADARTLDLFRLMIREANDHLLVVNTFPLTRELQRALILAVHRGVTVDLLVGNVVPRTGARRSVGSPLHHFADGVVHGRMRAVARAGARIWEPVVARRPTWAADVPFMVPHVHSKIWVADRKRVAIGSANTDTTSSYWESEVMMEFPKNRKLAAEIARIMEFCRPVELRNTPWATVADAMPRILL